MAELEIASRRIRETPNVLLLEVEGGIDAKSYPVLEQALAQVQKDGCCRLVLKLTGVRFMNEAERLLSYDATFRKAGGGMVLYEVPAKLRVQFGTLELDKKLAIRGSLDDAVAALIEGQPVDRRQRAKTVANDRRAPREGDRRAPSPAADAGAGSPAPSTKANAKPDAAASRGTTGNTRPASAAKPAAAPAAKSGTARPPSAAGAAPSPSAPRTGSRGGASGSAKSGPAPAPGAATAVAAPTPRRGSALMAVLAVGLVGAAYAAYAFLFAK